MPIRLVTLDCANTLLRGAWDPVAFALWASREAGLCLPANAGEAYGRILQRRYEEVLAANRTGNADTVRDAYLSIGEEWLTEVGVAASLAGDVVAASQRLLLDPKAGLFELFDDAVPLLKFLRERGVRTAVVSNWDVSLDSVLRAHGLRDLVDDVFASLVVGAEKPDPTMIRLAMEAASVGPEETLHVGDDPGDDLGAATRAGVKGLLIDRKAGCRKVDAIESLAEVMQWID